MQSASLSPGDEDVFFPQVNKKIPDSQDKSYVPHCSLNWVLLLTWKQWFHWKCWHKHDYCCWWYASHIHWIEGMWEDVLIVKLSEKDIEVKVPETNFACGIPIDLTGNFLWKPKGNCVSGELICSLTWAQKKKKRTIHVNTSNLQSRETECLGETERRYRAFHF